MTKGKTKIAPAATKLSKDMKSEVDKMLQKSNSKLDKRITTLEKRFEKLKGSDKVKPKSKASDKKGNTKKARSSKKQKGSAEQEVSDD